MATDLQGPVNETFRLFERFSRESKALVISSIALIASVIAVLAASLAAVSAIRADTKVDMELRNARAQIHNLDERIDVYIIYNRELYAVMVAHGLDPPPPPPRE